MSLESFFLASSFICGIHEKHTHQLMYIRTITHTNPQKYSRLIVHKVSHSHCTLTEWPVCKSYHWAACSTDKGHVIFFCFLMSYFWAVRVGNVLISNIDLGLSRMEAYCIVAGKNLMLCHNNNVFGLYLYFFLLFGNRFFLWCNKIISVLRLFLAAVKRTYLRKKMPS